MAALSILVLPSLLMHSPSSEVANCYQSSQFNMCHIYNYTNKNFNIDTALHKAAPSAYHSSETTSDIKSDLLASCIAS